MTAPLDDAGRFLAAVQAWAQRTLPAPPSGHPGPECQWCPLCQLASALRGEHPELGDIAGRAAEAGTAVAAALRALLESAARGAGGGGAAGPVVGTPPAAGTSPAAETPPAAGTSPPGEARRVERVVLDAEPPTAPRVPPRIERVVFDDGR